MQKIILQLLVLSILPLSATAQRLVFYEKAPKITAKEIIIGDKANKDLPTYLDFFVLNSPQNDVQLEALEKIASVYKDKINFILISKDDSDNLRNYFKDKNPSYTVMIDLDGETFSDFNVKFIPFSVIIDKKGNFVWHGKNSNISESTIQQIIK